MDNIEHLIDLLVLAAQPGNRSISGELDRRRSQQMASWQRLKVAGILNETDLYSLIKSYDSHLDYQRDHPLTRIDETLDMAIAVAQHLSKNDFVTVAALIDKIVHSRLITYAHRCASRSLTEGSVALCEAGLLALMISIDSDTTQADSRDMMVSLAPLHVAAQHCVSNVSELFSRYAEFTPDDIGKLVRAFGSRTDITLQSFGWILTANQHGSWVVLDN
jgi:hypothetical protein